MSNRLKLDVDVVSKRIFVIRGHRVMLDMDLAQLYGVSVGRLNEAVKRNTKRFPADFMFLLTKAEHESLRTENLKSQIAISSWGGRRHMPYAFTEQGVAMLSSVLRSERAIRVNIAIMRAFVRLRQLAGMNKELTIKLDELERRVGTHDVQIKGIFEAIRRLTVGPEPKDKRIGFVGLRIPLPR